MYYYHNYLLYNINTLLLLSIYFYVAAGRPGFALKQFFFNNKKTKKTCTRIGKFPMILKLLEPWQPVRDHDKKYFSENIELHATGKLFSFPQQCRTSHVILRHRMILGEHPRRCAALPHVARGKPRPQASILFTCNGAAMP